jgi:DNA-directed RNA polymerase specialized sigma24 family protein
MAHVSDKELRAFAIKAVNKNFCTMSREDREDLVQDVLIKLSTSKIDAAKNWQAYVWRTAINEGVNMKRRNGNRVQCLPLLEDPGATNVQTPLSSDVDGIDFWCRTRIPAKSYPAWMLFCEGRTLREISKITGLSLTSIYRKIKSTKNTTNKKKIKDVLET